MRYWWVNQNQTYKHEVAGGFLWSPKANSNGSRNQFYVNMTEVSPGDLVLSFCDTRIKAIGTVTGSAVSADKPDFGRAGDYWDKEGWFVPVEFTEVDNPPRPKDFIGDLLPHLRGKYDPLQRTGDGNQGVYLAEVSEGFIETILAHMGTTLEGVIAKEIIPPEVEDDKAQSALEGRTDIGDTQKDQLVRARRGQGIFKANVRLNEKHCRLTGIADPVLLIASHIKPWSKSSDFEKLDGCNGLLLSPHVDRLFDRGLISFDDDGTVLRSPAVAPEVWTAWGLDEIKNVGGFSLKQCGYLAYHRKHLFKPA
ncbi:HNH endonuclease [Sphingomonas segetis]|jgi:hypothetical protein|uniref:HNH endonuclease n=1 Tax=Sphingomonas segetis TaxID=1104779 RepID=UPI0012D2AF96|nr:HNH endonuclease signature motif containing protein [Sphingomonas segetis]